MRMVSLSALIIVTSCASACGPRGVSSDAGQTGVKPDLAPLHKPADAQSILTQFEAFKVKTTPAKAACADALAETALSLSASGDSIEDVGPVRRALLSSSKTCLKSASVFKSAIKVVHIKDAPFRAEFKRTMGACPTAFTEAANAGRKAATLAEGSATAANEEMQSATSMGNVCTTNLDTFADEVRNGISTGGF